MTSRRAEIISNQLGPGVRKRTMAAVQSAAAVCGRKMSDQNKNMPVDPEKNSEDRDRILVVDDDPAVRTMLYDVLTSQGYTVDLSEYSGDALEKLIDYRYRLLLLDARMPGISGFELLKYCKRHHPDMEIIMITGNPEIDDAVSTVKDGAFDYLVKPFSMEKLLSRVRDAIRTQKERLNDISRFSAPHEFQRHSASPLPGYHIVRTLGSGAMGVVFLVEKGSERYALKILRKSADDAAEEARISRFLREAEILSRIEHPNVVRIYRSGFPSDGTGVPFILMEYVEGRPLTDIIKKETPPLELKLDLIRQTADALSAVHCAGVVHRDIKPGNVLVTSGCIAKLTDFGIARITDSSLTMSHEMLGSPAYMPPEAFNSKQNLDCRSDIFSLGVLSYELLTGVKPFHGETVAEIMSAIQKVRPLDPVKLVPDLPLPVRAILARMLRKNPEQRYQSMADIVADLENLLGASRKEKKAGFSAILGKMIRSGSNVWS